MSVHKEFQSAVAAHRQAVAYVEQARESWQRDAAASKMNDRQRQLITRLAQAATVVAPGWLGRALDRACVEAALGESSAEEPLAVRIGQCVADADVRFPVIVNLLGTGHLAIDGEPTDPRVLAMLRGVPLRLLASRPSESLHVSFVDSTDERDVFAAFAPLVQAGMVAEHDFGDALAEAEAHLEQARRRTSGQRGLSAADLPERLLVIAGLPDSGEVAARLAPIVSEGADARLHLVVADSRIRPSSATTQTTHVKVTRSRVTVAGVPLPVRVDPPATDEVVEAVSARLAESRSWFIEDGLL